MVSFIPYDSVDISENRLFLVILDQTQLPEKEVFLKINKEAELFEAIKSLKVRGAPAIGIAAALGLCIILKNELAGTLHQISVRAFNIIKHISSARPTAVNLSWALGRMKNIISDSLANSGMTPDVLVESLFTEALLIKSEDIDRCRKISEYGLSLLKKDMGILTHCNAGHLAVSRLGTALGPIYLAHESGYKIRVYADETRPLLQGARLTTFELMKAGVDVTLICDNMASTVMSKGWVDAVFVGCDRVAKNGDVANKIGTSSLSVLARNWGIPVYVFGPTSSFDNECETGDDINYRGETCIGGNGLVF